MATLIYHIFLKSSLLFEIFLVEVKKYILSTFVSFQLVSRRISRAKEKTSLKCNKALCSIEACICENFFEILHRGGELWIFFSHTYDEKLQNIKNPVLSFYFINIFLLSVALLLRLNIYIIGLLIKKLKRFI